MMTILALTLIVAMIMAVMTTIPRQEVLEGITYEEAFKQAEKGDAKVVPILIRAWSDDTRTGNDNWSERWGEGEIPTSRHAGKEYDEFSKKVIASFYYIGAKNALPYIFKELKNRDKSRRKLAKRVIQLLISRSIIDEACMPVILEALKDRNDEVRYMATVIAGSRSKVFISSLKRLLKDRNKIIRYESAFALSKLHEKSAKPFLLSALKDNNPQIRHEALYSLGLIGKGDPQITTKIMKLLKDKEIDVVNSAIKILGILGDKKATAKLIEFLNVEYPNLQLTAITSLGKLGDKTAIPHLKQRLKNITTNSIEGPVGDGSFVKIPAKDFRQEIGIALCNLGDEEGIRILKEFIPQASIVEKERMIKALKNTTHKSAIPIFTKILLGKEPYGRDYAMEGLVNIGKASIPIFEKGIRSKDNKIQQLSIHGLGRIKDKSSTIILSNLLGNKELKHLAISALVNLGTLSIPVLIRKLKAKNTDIETASIIALGKIGDKSAVPSLIKKLQSKNPQIRLEAIIAIGNIKDNSTIPALLKALKDDETKIASSKILCEMGNKQGVRVILNALKQKVIKPKEVLFSLAKSKDKNAIIYLKKYYYHHRLIRAEVSRPKVESIKYQIPLDAFEDEDGTTFVIFNWHIYGSYNDLWLMYSKDKKKWSLPIFTGLVSNPKRPGRVVIPLESNIKIEKNKIILYGKVKEKGPFGEENIHNWQKITTLSELTQDTDKDGLTDIEELRFMTNPKDQDTDNDEFLDGIDVNPLVGKVKMDDEKLIRQAIFVYNCQGISIPLVIVKVNDEFEKQQFLGLNGTVLCLTPIELAKFREKIGYGIPIYSFGEIKYDESKEKAEVEFIRFVRPKYARGFIFKLEKIHDVWVVVDSRIAWVS
jgi:HEAT repeat protein